MNKAIIAVFFMGGVMFLSLVSRYLLELDAARAAPFDSHFFNMSFDIAILAAGMHADSIYSAKTSENNKDNTLSSWALLVGIFALVSWFLIFSEYFGFNISHTIWIANAFAVLLLGFISWGD